MKSHKTTHKKIILLASVIILASLEASQTVKADEQTVTDSKSHTLCIPESGTGTSAPTSLPSQTAPEKPADPQESQPAEQPAESAPAAPAVPLNQTETEGAETAQLPETAAPEASAESSDAVPQSNQTGQPVLDSKPAEAAKPADQPEAQQEAETDKTGPQLDSRNDNPDDSKDGDKTSEQAENPENSQKPQQETETEVPSLKDDYYAAINHDWLKETQLPDDKSSVGAAEDAQQLAEDRIKETAARLLAGEETACTDGMADFVKLYAQAMDADQRQADGTAPLKPYLDRIASLESLEDFAQQIPQLGLQGHGLPFGIGIETNPEDSTSRIINLSMPGTILTEHQYKDETVKTQYLTAYKEVAGQILVQLGYDAAAAEQLTNQAIAFDSLLVPHQPSAEESSQTSTLINSRTAQEVNAYAPHLALDQAIAELIGQPFETVNVSTPAYFEHLSQILTAENFDKLKSWMLVNEALNNASYLTEELRQAVQSWTQLRSGDPSASTREEAALSQARGYFGDAWSVYYGQKYQDPQTVADVTEMAKRIVSVYKERLTANDWLSPETKAQAIKKLDAIRFFIGAPEEVSELTKQLKVDEQLSYFDNIRQLIKTSIAYGFNQFKEPVNRDNGWAKSFVVNAYYQATTNSIAIPTAFLTAPMYDASQSKAANYGALGVVIGHEISHAFDTNGSLFDENGNIRNWWTPEDYAAFSQRTEDMVKLFDGVETEHGLVNGRLTVTENTADAGGIATALAALRGQDAEADLTAFFENYARLWRQLRQPQLAANLLLQDTHAPGKVRTNVQLANSETFQKVYDIQPGDGMYLEADKRVVIW